MLGSLARWLRILGFDTAYDNQLDDEALVRLSLAEGRVLITRDRRLVKRRVLRSALFIRSNTLGGQIAEVLVYAKARVVPGQVLTRCVVCNALLKELGKEEAHALVPPYVFQTQETFRRCPVCSRVFWAGTHRQHIMDRLVELGREAGRPDLFGGAAAKAGAAPE